MQTSMLNDVMKISDCCEYYEVTAGTLFLYNGIFMLKLFKPYHIETKFPDAIVFPMLNQKINGDVIFFSDEEKRSIKFRIVDKKNADIEPETFYAISDTCNFDEIQAGELFIDDVLQMPIIKLKQGTLIDGEEQHGFSIEGKSIKFLDKQGFKFYKLQAIQGGE